MSRGRAKAGGGEAGFTLLEVVCALAIVAALATLALPRLAPGTSRARLESLAVEAAALLKADRAAAIRRGVPVATAVDATGRRMTSGSAGRVVRVPGDVQMDTVLPATCDGRPARASVQFFPSGLSCGGVVAMLKGGTGYEVRVNWLTGGVEIVPRGRS